MTDTMKEKMRYAGHVLTRLRDSSDLSPLVARVFNLTSGTMPANQFFESGGDDRFLRAKRAKKNFASPPLFPASPPLLRGLTKKWRRHNMLLLLLTRLS